MDASGWCPCPAAQYLDPEAVKLLVLPHTIGANLYRVVDGTLRKGVTEEGFKEVVGEAFAAVRFPSMPCHLWRVVKVEGWWHNGQDVRCPSEPPRWRLPIRVRGCSAP